MCKFDKDTYPYSVYNTDVGQVRVVHLPTMKDMLPHKMPTAVGTATAKELNRLRGLGTKLEDAHMILSLARCVAANIGVVAPRIILGDYY